MKTRRSSAADMRSYSLNSNPSESLRASTFSAVFVLLSACVLALAIFINTFLPKPLEPQEEKASACQCLLNKFDARRVYDNLEKLSSIGPKVPGSYENEVRAATFIIDNIKETINSTEGRVNKIEYDVQVSSGCWCTKKFCHCYHNVQNIVAKLKPISAATDESILVNCHFDSAPSSPGASDDGLHCNVMLELLRVLATKNEPLKKNVIFLFNGAEEDGLLGSHGFITKHQWVSEIVCFINLESCGGGGREILFQTGPKADILPKIYAESVPYPYGNVIGEELFQTGLLPSDTDFRIFRDYGRLKGLDFAHYKNGYVYHTSSDNISFVSISVIQHTGANILALLQRLTDEDNLKTILEKHDEQVVFYDILGQFMVCYSMTNAFRINISVVVLSLLVSTFLNIKIFRKRQVKSLSYHYALNLAFFGLGILLVTVVTYALAEFLKFCGFIMLWYSQPWFAIAYYGVPALLTLTTVMKLRRICFYSTVSLEEEMLIFLIIPQIILTFLLLIATLLEIRTSYVLVIKLIPLCFSFLINHTILRKVKVWKRIILHLIFNFVSAFYFTYLAVPFFQLLIPMMGRMGATANTELFMGYICQFVILGLFLFFVPFVILVRNFWRMQLVSLVFYIGFVLIMLCGSVLKSFSDNAPERFEILHVNRKLFHPGNQSKIESNGFFLIAVDPRAPQTVNTIFKEDSFKPVSEFCRKELLCGVPMTKQSYQRNNFEHSFWSSSAFKPMFPSRRNLNFETKEESRTKTFFFSVSGPPSSFFVVQPFKESKLIEWSLTSDEPESSITWFDEGVFVFNYVRGREDQPLYNNSWSFWLKFDTSQMKNEPHIFKLAWSAHYRSNNETHFDSNFRKVLDKFPEWTRFTSWVTELEEPTSEYTAHLKGERAILSPHSSERLEMYSTAGFIWDDGQNNSTKENPLSSMTKIPEEKDAVKVEKENFIHV